MQGTLSILNISYLLFVYISNEFTFHSCGRSYEILSSCTRWVPEFAVEEHLDEKEEKEKRGKKKKKRKRNTASV